MQRTSNRLATGVFAVITGLAVASVSTAYAAEEGPVEATTCGAGVLTQCGTEKQENCDWAIKFEFGWWKLKFEISESNCKIVGETPMYKDRERSSTTTVNTSCDPSATILGMPTKCE